MIIKLHKVFLKEKEKSRLVKDYRLRVRVEWILVLFLFFKIIRVSTLFFGRTEMNVIFKSMFLEYINYICMLRSNLKTNKKRLDTRILLKNKKSTSIYSTRIRNRYSFTSMEKRKNWPSKDSKSYNFTLIFFYFSFTVKMYCMVPSLLMFLFFEILNLDILNASLKQKIWVPVNRELKTG